MTPKESYYLARGERVVKAAGKRNLNACYCQNRKEAVEAILKMIPDGSSVSWGGTMTLEDIGLMERLAAGKYTLLDRSKANSPEETEAIYAKALQCDYYLMSSNAVTDDGQLVNIDGRGNRLAALIYGPKNVIVVAGMNKVTASVSEALSRVSNVAAPINTQRLSRNTPCAINGVCAECLADDCICSHTVITRRSMIKGRISLILVGEELGF